MSSTTKQSAKDVRSKLNYVYNDGKRPFLYARPRTKADPHSEDYGGTDDLIETWIRDGRQHDLSLNQHGFELVQNKTQLSRNDFESDQQIRSAYYKEIEQLIEKATGAAHVVCFHHQVRDGTTSSNGKGTKEYAYDVHTDSSPSSAEESFFDALELIKKNGDDADVEQYKTGRFLFINAWRNIAETPIQNNHLAVCDETSLVKPDDYISYDYFEREYASVHYKLSSRNFERHRWYYFPEMMRDKVLLFKQFDSDPDQAARMCFHASFADPTAETDNTLPRQSIEVRAMAFFPNHEPNTCPRPESRIRVGVSKILLSVDYLHEWPRLSRWWFTDLVKKGQFEAILDSLLEDKDNELGFKGEQDQEFLAAVRQQALESGFVDHATRAAAKK